MFLFTAEEQHQLRDKAKRQPEIVTFLREKCGYLKGHTLLVPEMSEAQWDMYYTCPYDSAKLEFRFEHPHEHRCPVCGRVQRGQPYDGVWWTVVHGSNEETAYRQAFYYFLTGDAAAAAFVKQVLLAYAAHYPGYQAHGNVPYNGPGKTHAQTLNEAVFLRKLSYAYDLTKDQFTPAERQTVCSRLFAPGGAFLLAHRTAQLHNHEVLVGSQIALLGLLLEDKNLLEKGLYDDYGLLYQLEHGMTADGFWFEGTLGYQMYALEAFFAYEVFARHTPHHHLDHPNYKIMLGKISDYLLENDTLPALNDSRFLGKPVEPLLIYEFGYQWYRDGALLDLLHAVWRHADRNKNTAAFFFGVDTLPEKEPDRREKHNGALTLLRGGDQKYLLVKHDAFGGEHDHYDRLSVSFSAFGKQLMMDLGTIFYGTFHHRAYFKNSGTHNTVTVGEENQPPAKASVYAFRRREADAYLDVGVDFDAPYTLPDSFVIKEWNGDAYRGVKFRRRILWMEAYWIDVFLVSGRTPRQMDYTLHTAGERVRSGRREEAVVRLSEKQPLCHLKEVTRETGGGVRRQAWRDGGVTLTVFSQTDGCELFYGKGLNCPVTETVSFYLERQTGTEAVFVNVIEAWKGSARIEDVRIQVGKTITVQVLDRTCGWKEYTIDGRH